MFGVDIALILQETSRFASNMITNLEPTVKYVFGSMCIIDLTLSMLWDESDGLNIFMKLVKKIFYYCFFWYIIINYREIVFKYLFTGFIQLGNLAANGSMDKTISIEVLNKYGPELGDLAVSFISGAGFMALDYLGVESASTLGLGLVVAYIIFFLMLYIQIVTTFIKFYFMAGYSYVLMPFAGFEKTKDITSKALNGLFSQAVEIFVLVVMINYLEYLDDFAKSTSDIKGALWTRWVLIWFMYFMLNRTGAIASSMLSGAIATLGIGAATMADAQGKMTGAVGKGIGSQMNAASAVHAKTTGTSNERNGGYFTGAYNKAGAGASKAYRTAGAGANRAYRTAANFVNRFRG